jgi:hypothetical protein
MELQFFKNKSGTLIAVSYDDGDTIVLPSGKVMEVTDAWEDVVEDLTSELSEQQNRILANWRSSRGNSEMGALVRNYSRNRKLQEERDGTEREPERRRISPDVLVVVSDFD